MNSDVSEYFTFTGRLRLEKSINLLIGLIEGISIDGSVNTDEISFIYRWIAEHAELKHRHPYNELMPVLLDAAEDGRFSDEEREDILWLCGRHAGHTMKFPVLSQP